MAERKLVVIEEGTLVSMAYNASFVKEFPFLASLMNKAVKKQGCGTCGRANAERTTIFSAAKATIVGLASDKKRKLKEMLNARHIRVTYKNNAGKIVQLTF